MTNSYHLFERDIHLAQASTKFRKNSKGVKGLSGVNVTTESNPKDRVLLHSYELHKQKSKLNWAHQFYSHTRTHNKSFSLQAVRRNNTQRCSTFQVYQVLHVQVQECPPSKCRCGPVARPVAPTAATCCPFTTCCAKPKQNTKKSVRVLTQNIRSTHWRSTMMQKLLASTQTWEGSGDSYLRLGNEWRSNVHILLRILLHVGWLPDIHNCKASENRFSIIGSSDTYEATQSMMVEKAWWFHC